MNELKRTALRLTIELEWQKAKRDYAAVEKAFGDQRRVGLWGKHGQRMMMK